MEIFREMANQQPRGPKDEFAGQERGKAAVARGSTRYGDDMRASSIKEWSVSPGSRADGKAKAPVVEDGVRNDSTALVGRARIVNFSLFLRPVIVKATRRRCGLEELGRGSSFVQKEVDIMKETGTNHQTCGPDEKVCPKFPKRGVKNISQDAEPSANPGPDKRLLEPSSTPASTMEEKRMQCQGLTCDLRFPASSACSQRASNDPKVTLKRRYEDCQSSSQSDSDSEDSERMQRSSSTKERRSSVHNSSSERRRRGRVNKKLRALQELLPDCDEVDQIAVLDEAIEYLKTLQRQLLVLLTGLPMYMSPPMMLPAGIQQMYTPFLNQFPAVNVPRGMNVGAGIGCGRLQVPISPSPTTTASVGMQTLGLQSMACIPPFIPSFGQSSAPSLSTQAPSTDAVNLLDSAAQFGSNEIA